MFDLVIPFVRQTGFDAEAPDLVYRSTRTGNFYKVKMRKRDTSALRGAPKIGYYALEFSASWCDENGKALEHAGGPKDRFIARSVTQTIRAHPDLELETTLEKSRVAALIHVEAAAMSAAKIAAALSA